MNKLALAAPAAATVVAAIALGDAATYALTGQYSVFAEGGPRWATTPGDLAHGLLYAVLIAVLITRRAQIDAGSRARRWTRRILVALLAPLAVTFLVGLVLRPDAAPALSAVSGAAFLLSFPATATLGIMLARVPGMRLPATLMITVLGGLALTILLAVLGSRWAHPGYAEALQFFGIALLARLPWPASVPATTGRLRVRAA